MKKSVIQKSVDEINAKALATYEASVKSIVERIKAQQATIVQHEHDFAANVAYAATNIAAERAALAKLTPPPTITAVEIFGKEVVEAATE